uniref:Cation/H+ exchanger domain-containing protein n=1 Tax=Romanomermis culicivorax TaxID=13658 RepID=A0A915IY59_ROMCU
MNHYNTPHSSQEERALDSHQCHMSKSMLKAFRRAAGAVPPLVNIRFFVSSGLKTNMNLLNDGTTWLWLFIVIFTAIFGKLIGCLITARLVGMGWRESFTVGILMNTKGLIGLIAFNVGHDTKLINDHIFLIMVIMTLTTTFITSPVLSAVYSPKYWKTSSKQRPSGRLSVTTRKRMSVFHKISQTFSSSSQRGSLSNVDGQESIAKISLLLYLGDDFGPLISMVRLMLLFQVDQFASNVQVADSLSISVLKIVEPTERTSSIMITKKIDEVVKTDVGLNMMRMFTTIVNVPVNSLASVSPASEIGDEVNQIAVSESCDLVLVPYNGQKAVGGLTSRSKVEKIRDIVRTVRRAAVCVVASKSNLVSGIDTVSVCSLLAVVGGTTEDELVLKLACRFIYCKSFAVHITILKFQDQGPDPATVTEKLIGRLTTECSANVTLNDDQGISRNQSETTLDGTAMRLSPTMEQRRGNNVDDSDSLASTKSKKKRIEMETLGIVGQSLFNSNDLNAVLLVISQNV